MMKKLFILAVITLLGLTISPLARADRIDELESELKALREKMESVQAEVEALKDKERVQAKEVEELKETVAVAEVKRFPEIEIGGQYRVMGNSMNTSWHPASISNDEDTQSFFNQRFRTWLTIAPNENVSGYLETEIGHITWGQNYEWTKTYAGPSDVPGHDDRVGIELRRGYLTYRPEELGSFRVGIQDWSDSFGDILASSDWDFNVGGISFTRQLTELGETDLKLGVFNMWEGDSTRSIDSVLFAGDLDLPMSEESSVGVSLYYLNDNDGYSYPDPSTGYTANYPTPSAGYDSSWDSWLGIRGKTRLGDVPLNGAFIVNKGEMVGPGWKHTGYAMKLEGAYELTWGKLSLQGIYTSGDDNPDDNNSNEFRTIAQSERDNLGSQGYWSYLTLTSPRGASDVQDLGVGLQNRGFGLTTIQGKMEFPITDKLSGYLAAGWLKATENNSANSEDDMGTELVGEVTYDLGGGLKLDVGAGYLFTGDFYKSSANASSPDDLVELYTRLQLEF